MRPCLKASSTQGNLKVPFVSTIGMNIELYCKHIQHKIINIFDYQYV